MEDSHVVSLDIGNGVSFFGVYDGHGGKFQIVNHSKKEMKSQIL